MYVLNKKAGTLFLLLELQRVKCEETTFIMLVSNNQRKYQFLQRKDFNSESTVHINELETYEPTNWRSFIRFTSISPRAATDKISSQNEMK